MPQNGIFSMAHRPLAFLEYLCILSVQGYDNEDDSAEVYATYR